MMLEVLMTANDGVGFIYLRGKRSKEGSSMEVELKMAGVKGLFTYCHNCHLVGGELTYIVFFKMEVFDEATKGRPKTTLNFFLSSFSREKSQFMKIFPSQSSPLTLTKWVIYLLYIPLVW